MIYKFKNNRGNWYTVCRVTNDFATLKSFGMETEHVDFFIASGTTAKNSLNLLHQMVGASYTPITLHGATCCYMSFKLKVFVRNYTACKGVFIHRDFRPVYSLFKQEDFKIHDLGMHLPAGSSFSEHHNFQKDKPSVMGYSTKGVPIYSIYGNMPAVLGSKDSRLFYGSKKLLSLSYKAMSRYLPAEYKVVLATTNQTNPKNIEKAKLAVKILPATALNFLSHLTNEQN